MSVGTTCDESKVALLSTLLAGAQWSGAQMGLSTTNITPDHATVAADLVPGEVSVTGYTRQSFGAWPGPTIDGSFRATTTGPPLTFVNTGGVDSPVIYCWFVMSADGVHLIEAGRFDLPFVLVATTGSYPTTPTTRLTGE